MLKESPGRVIPLAEGNIGLFILMTREKAIHELQLQQGNGDIECAHSYADDIICDLLRTLGYGDVVAEWEKVDKWYA